MRLPPGSIHRFRRWRIILKGAPERLSKTWCPRNMRLLSLENATFRLESGENAPVQVNESLLSTSRPAPPRPPPENQQVWPSLLKGKTAVIQEVAE